MKGNIGQCSLVRTFREICKHRRMKTILVNICLTLTILVFYTSIQTSIKNYQVRMTKSDHNDKENVVATNWHTNAWWQDVSGFPTHKNLVYSAFYDKRNLASPVIRVVGIGRNNLAHDWSKSVNCRLYFNENQIEPRLTNSSTNGNFSKTQNTLQNFVDVEAEIVPLGETPHFMFYHDCHILCPLEGNLIPDTVSVFPTSYDLFKNVANLEITNRLMVINSNNGGTGTFQAENKDIGVCVKPLWSNYNNTLALIEFIEFNKLVGVSKFIFYNESISDEVSRVLQYYMDIEKIVSIVPWNLPSKIEIDYIPNRGVLSSLNDCIYRNMNNFGYLMTIDIDEFIVPHMHNSIQEMLKYLDSTKLNHMEFHYSMYKPKDTTQSEVDLKQERKLRGITSYNFQNAFFYLGFGECFLIFKHYIVMY